MSQCQEILAHLRKRPITPAEAYTKYRCMRLAARIKDLKERGHQIITQIIEQNGTRFARYILVKEKQ